MLDQIRARDTKCVYCGRKFENGVRPSIEHIINDITMISFENIAICCIGCNASKGQKSLSVWLTSEYCINRKIGVESISPVISEALAKEIFE